MVYQCVVWRTHNVAWHFNSDYSGREAQSINAPIRVHTIFMSNIGTRVYKALADEIIKGKLRPGEKLDERTLAERFEVSRTPVREALRLLGSRGLVDISPRRVGVVANIGIDRLAELLDADGELEALCARRSAEYMNAMEKKELEFLHEQGAGFVEADDTENYLVNNDQFHRLLCAGAHNEVLGSMVEDLRSRLAPFRQAQPELQVRLSVSHAEHTAVVEAILKGDPEAAYRSMRGHNARLSTAVIRLLRSQHEMARKAA
jgi:DNA-binding GntR family transcriptional regulator